MLGDVLRDDLAELGGRVDHPLAGELSRRRIQVAAGAQHRDEGLAPRDALRRDLDLQFDPPWRVLRDAVELHPAEETAGAENNQCDDQNEYLEQLFQYPSSCLTRLLLTTSRASRVVLQDVAVFHADSTVPDTLVRAIARIRSANFFRTARVKGACVAMRFSKSAAEIRSARTPHGLAAPLVEELCGPGGRTIFPELLKSFLQKVGADGLEIVAKEIAQPEVLVGAKVLTTAEQQPAGFPEDGGAALTSHAAGFLGTDVVQCLVHIGSDVKAVKDMQRLGAVFADQLQIGFPHVGTSRISTRSSERKQVDNAGRRGVDKRWRTCRESECLTSSRGESTLSWQVLRD